LARAIEFHPEAEAELAAATSWYEAERRGIGAVFASAVRDAVQRAAEAPLTGGRAGGELRRLFVHRFPYAILYAADPERIFVVAVAHYRRRPGYWKHRR
jgi:plasmid stabilization system protein ParE